MQNKNEIRMSIVPFPNTKKNKKNKCHDDVRNVDLVPRKKKAIVKI